ncbi:MAG: hypothetical protein WBF71_15420 [Microthrixaceae bacterium]
MDPFHSTWHKFDRVCCHAQRVVTQSQQFAASDPQLQPELHYDLVTSELVVRVATVEQPPVSMALTLGDVLSCYRQALDHVAWDMVGRGSAQLSPQDARRVQFPIVDWPTTPQERAPELQRIMNRQLPGIAQSHQTLVESSTVTRSGSTRRASRPSDSCRRSTTPTSTARCRSWPRCHQR